jgi:hypothetical protein
MGRRFAHTACRNLALANVDQSIEKGARREDDGTGGKTAAIFRLNAGDKASIHDESACGTLDNLKPGLAANRTLHRLPIELPVGLGARAADGRALGAVQQTELDARLIGNAAHQSVERVDLPHKVAFAESADSGIARHFADGTKFMSNENGSGAGARRRTCGFNTRMPAAHNDDIKVHAHGALFSATRSLGQRTQVSRETRGSFADAEFAEDFR